MKTRAKIHVSFLAVTAFWCLVVGGFVCVRFGAWRVLSHGFFRSSPIGVVLVAMVREPHICGGLDFMPVTFVVEELRTNTVGEIASQISFT